jgi:NtrC-family two-component system sensor histidine kinase KinB
MARQRLLIRFVLAGGLLVATTIACGFWSAVTFAHLGSVVDQTLGHSQETIDLAATLSSLVEREDDTLLLAPSGDRERSRRELQAQREEFDLTWQRLEKLSTGRAEKVAVGQLRGFAAEYRHAGDAFLRQAGRPSAHAYYLREVNPALRKTVAGCARVRELSFQSLERAGIRARDSARRATGIVGVISLFALGLSTVVSFGLARSVVRPIRALTDSLEAVTRGDFARRLPVRGDEEFAVLAEGFNHMAQALADYRSSSLGELLQAKTTMEATLTALPDGVLVIDAEEYVVTANPVAAEILQATGSADARRLEDLPLTPEGVRIVRETIHGHAEAGNRTDLSRVRPVPLNGRPARFTLGVAAIPDARPGRCGAVVVLADVTEFARLDELRSELIAVASHELKTPLTSVRMNLLLLQEDLPTPTPRQREILEAAITAVEELASTIDELLDLTRIESGQLRLGRERVDLAALVEQCVRTMWARFRDAEIAAVLVVGSGEARVSGDVARLRIVFMNILGNAIKYTPRRGRVTVAVSAAAAAGLAEVTVTDTGPGVEPAYRQRIFEKFFRVEHERPDGPEAPRGVGIGLYLCGQIVEAHQGTIDCTAGEQGTGTRITVHLPLAGDEA